MQVGDLVSYKSDGDLGIIFDKDATGMYPVSYTHLTLPTNREV